MKLILVLDFNWSSIFSLIADIAMVFSLINELQRRKRNDNKINLIFLAHSPVRYPVMKY